MARLIRASEVGEYVFCHRAWWLRMIEGYIPGSRGRLEAGTARHSSHARRVGLSAALLLAGLAALALSLAGLLLGL